MAPGDKLNERAAAWSDVIFEASPVPWLGVVAASIPFVAGGAAMVLGYIGPPIQSWSLPWLAGWAVLTIFGACGAFGIKQAMTRGAIVTVGPRGVRDVRISPDWIPWTAITEVAEQQDIHSLMLCIDPAFEATMSLTRKARWAKLANAPLGCYGYVIPARGLKGGFNALKRAIEDGLARAHGG